MKAKDEAGSGKRGSPWAVGVALVVTLVVMGRLCGMDFEWWDDDKIFLHNSLMNPAGWGTVWHYWTHQFMGLYVPVVYTVWAGLAAVARVEPDARGVALNPWVFHAFNVMVHLLNVGLVYLVLRRVVPKSRWAAGVGAAVFGVHPVQVETVAWVAGLKDLMCGTFVLLGVWQYLIFAQGRRDGEAGRRVRGHYWVGLGCVVVGTLCKPTAVVAPVIVAVLDLWVVGRGWREVVRDVWPWGVAVVPCVIWAKMVQTVAPRGPMWSRPLVTADAVAFYLRKLVWPGETGIDYGRNPKHVIATGQVWWTWVVPAVAAVGLWVGRRRVPVLVGAGLVFVAGMLPVLGLTPFMFQGYSTVADHYLYLPMLGVAMGAAWVINRWPTRAVGVVAGIVIVLLGVKSVAEEGVWEDDVSLFRHAVAVNPGSAEMRVNLASALQLESEREGSRELQDEAVEQLRESLRIRPESVTASENLAVLMIQRGRVDEAIKLLLNAIAVADRVPPEEREKLGPSHRVLGAVLERRGRLAEAEEQYRAALEYEPGSKEIEGDLERVRKREAGASRPATTRSGGK